MKFIIIHRNTNCAADNDSLLRFAISSEPIASLVIEGLIREFTPSEVSSLRWGRNSKVICAIPEEWNVKPHITVPKIIPYTENVPVYSEFVRKTKPNRWFIISNGRFATQINSKLLERVLAGIQADVVAVHVEPGLLAYREKVRLTIQGKVAGFRRLYSDSAESAPIPTDWPHHIFVKADVLDQVFDDRTLPQSFSTFLERCGSAALTLQAVNLAGVAFDLETEDGLLNFCSTKLRKIHNSKFKILNSNTISQDSKLVGAVLLGKDVHIGPKAVVVGPTIIGDNVRIKKGAVINSSIIGPGIIVPQNQLVQNCVVRKIKSQNSNIKNFDFYSLNFDFQKRANGTFHSWPRFSYARYFKRIADCLAAIIVLILFAPIMPFIALAIKLASPGPVFFKDKRQGLHGKEFNCLKFRSMTVGAGTIQERLRMVSQVDGPQFKMTDDPRLITVGRFLRDTYIDEIPQFFNVLLGQMSVVGPRPSPESENALCPYWRDTRLSVRPGITGLWQICRTRRPMKDFQEWIHYDTEYVRNLRLRMDLWISWHTVKKLFDNFINQF